MADLNETTADADPGPLARVSYSCGMFSIESLEVMHQVSAPAFWIEMSPEQSVMELSHGEARALAMYILELIDARE